MSTIARLTLAQYDDMIRRGVFGRGPRQRLEFIRGEIREMTPIGSEHEEVVDRLTEWSFAGLPRKRCRIRIQEVDRIAGVGKCPRAGSCLGGPAELSPRPAEPRPTCSW